MAAGGGGPGSHSPGSHSERATVVTGSLRQKHLPTSEVCVCITVEVIDEGRDNVHC